MPWRTSPASRSTPLFGRRATEFQVEDGSIRGLECVGPRGMEEYPADAVLIATGG